MTGQQKAFQQEILAAAKAGNPQAIVKIIQGLLPTAKIIADKLFSTDREDMVQEGLIGLLAAIETFDASAGVSFKTYASRCMKNAMLTAHKKASAKKRMGNKLSLSDLDEENLTSGDSLDPQQIIAQRETLAGFIKLAKASLSPFEREVLQLHLQGYSYSDISSRLDKPEKSIDNALQRVRKKLKNAMDIKMSGK